MDLRILLALVLLGTANLAHGLEMLKVFGAPSMFEPVMARAFLPGCKRIDAVRFETDAFVVHLGDTPCGVPPEGPFAHDFSLGQLPQGRYRVRIVDAEERPFGEALMFEVSGSALPASDARGGIVDASGFWWDPRRNGESVSVLHRVAADRLMIAWNAYDASGQARWYVLLSIAAGHYDTHLLAVYEPARSGLRPVGSATFELRDFEFPEPAHAQLDVNFADGSTHAVALRRYP